jgi:hypothetical protein
MRGPLSIREARHNVFVLRNGGEGKGREEEEVGASSQSRNAPSPIN